MVLDRPPDAGEDGVEAADLGHGQRDRGQLGRWWLVGRSWQGRCSAISGVGGGGPDRQRGDGQQLMTVPCDSER